MSSAALLAAIAAALAAALSAAPRARAPRPSRERRPRLDDRATLLRLRPVLAALGFVGA